jgi:signal transduction histidine kinase
VRRAAVARRRDAAINVETFASVIAARLRENARALSRRWLERLNDILAVEPNDIFPTDDLLDHIPQLIEQIADYLAAPAVEELAANSGVVSKARELGLLRHSQQASVHQLLREYHLLGAIVETFLQEQMATLRDQPAPGEVLAVAARVAHALRILQQTTIDTFIAEYTDRIAAQQARLEGFNKLVSHELRQPLGTLQFSVRLLGDGSVDTERRARLFEILEMNVQRLVHLTGQLERIARVQHHGEAAARQEVDVRVLAREVARQLRDMAEHRGVEIRTAPDLPVVITDVARLELILINLVSNGIKYSDPAKTERFVDIFVSGASDDGRTVCVRDNGIGVAAADVPFIFESFYRASPEAHAEVKGSGLGLAIVAECAEAIGARITVGTVEGVGTAFDLWLPAAMPPAVETP